MSFFFFFKLLKEISTKESNEHGVVSVITYNSLQCFRQETYFHLITQATFSTHISHPVLYTRHCKWNRAGVGNIPAKMILR